MKTVLVTACMVCGGAAAADSDLDLEALSRSVARLRQLEFHHPVKYETESRQELRARMQAMLEEEWGDKKIEGLRRSLVAFGLIEPGLDLRALVTDLLTEQVAGFYDPESKQLFLTEGGAAGESGVPGEELLMGLLDIDFDHLVLAHELTHALDDQHFDLKKLQDGASALDDGLIAVQALEEGVATFVMMLYLFDRAGIDPDEAGRLLGKFGDLASLPGGADSPVLDRTPDVLKRSLIFPYQEGLKFVLEHHGEGGWEAINALMRRPPVSSEQILHPRKAMVPQDEPAQVGLPDLGGKKLTEATLGELDIISLLEMGEPLADARRSAAGWGGDRFALYDQRRDLPDLLLWKSRWDDVAEAEEFTLSLVKLLDQRFPGPDSIPSPEKGRQTLVLRRESSPSKGWILLERRGAEVLLVQGARKKDLTSIRARAWRPAGEAEKP